MNLEELEAAYGYGGSREEVMRIVRDVDPSETAPHGVTAVHIAARQVDPEAMEALLDRGFRAGAIDEYGNTPLHILAVQRWEARVSKMAECSLVPAGRREVYAREARLCSLNPLGTKAADFVFSDRYGKSYSLYGIRAPYTLLFFSNPGCHACKDIIDVLSGDPGISAAVKAGKLAVLNIYIDSDLTEWYRYMPVYPDEWYNGYDPNLVIRNDMLYNIRAIPSLYLLDEDKRVILKDAPQETVFAWLANNI